MPLIRCVGLLAAFGLIWLTSLSVVSCGGDASTTSVGDASIGDGATSDASGRATDGFVGDEPTEDSGDTGAADGAPEGAAYDVTIPDERGVGDADGATMEDAILTEAAEGGDASSEDGGGGCSLFGAPGQCTMAEACAALGDHTSYPDHCPGPATIGCCIKTPSTTDNPPVPAGYMLIQQSQVTQEMTAWAVMILNDPTTYPRFDTVTKTFGAMTVLARVEWEPPDFQNSVVHRGVTLYVPI